MATRYYLGFITRLVFMSLGFLFLAFTINLSSMTASAIEPRSGTSGTCTWELNAEGGMVIRPTEGEECMLNNSTGRASMTFDPYRNQIITISFEDEVFGNTNIRDVFAYMPNLTSIDFNGFNTSNTISMYELFYGDSKITSLDLSGFDTTNVSNMSRMFWRCDSLKELNLSSFDTTNTTNMSSMFGPDSGDLNRIVLGSKMNFHIDQNWGSPFSRGTWRRLEDGQVFSMAEICRMSLSGVAAGIYVKIGNTSPEMKVTFPVDYKILELGDIDEFTTDSPETFYQQNAGDVWVNIPVVTSEQYVLPGTFTVVFKDSVIDKNENQYDLKITIDNINYYDINNNGGVIKKRIATTKTYNITNLAITDGAFNFVNGATSAYRSVACDTVIEILDKDGNNVNGSYIFSIYDLDTDNSPRDPDGFGYYSEGVTLLSGFDLSTATMIEDTRLQVLDDNRFTGTVHNDPSSEYTEFLIKGDARGSKFTWTTSSACGSAILAYYQPEIVKVVKQDEAGNNIAGARLELYYDGEKINEWVSEKEERRLWLMPGEYMLKEIEAPEGYERSSESITFFVDIDNWLTVNNTNVDSIILKNKKNEITKGSDIKVPDTGVNTMLNDGVLLSATNLNVMLIFIGALLYIIFKQREKEI